MDYDGYLSIYKSHWEKSVKIVIQCRETFFRSMIFGLMRANWQQKYKEGQEELIRAILTEQFPNLLSCWEPNKGNWIWCVNAKNKYITRGEIIDDDFRYAFSDKLEEQAALDCLMNDLVKLKDQIPLIESLVS